MIVIANSSPLIYLSALSDLELLPKLFREVHIPPAVWREVVDQGGVSPVRAAVLAAVDRWLRLTQLTSPAEALVVPGRMLHAGEIEVIRLGEQMHAEALLIDDRTAVIQARAMGFRVVPTVAIYIEAKRRGLLLHVMEKVDRLRRAGFRLSESDYQSVLAAAGER